MDAGKGIDSWNREFESHRRRGIIPIKYLNLCVGENNTDHTTGLFYQ